MAPRPRVGWQAGVIPEGARTAAALLLLYPIGDRAHVCLTRRAGSLGTHAGQISLPGGTVDDGETIERAALREAHEEIGLDGDGLLHLLLLLLLLSARGSRACLCAQTGRARSSSR